LPSFEAICHRVEQAEAQQEEGSKEREERGGRECNKLLQAQLAAQLGFKDEDIPTNHYMTVHIKSQAETELQRLGNDFQQMIPLVSITDAKLTVIHCPTSTKSTSQAFE
jgi:hypothetical protein